MKLNHGIRQGMGLGRILQITLLFQKFPYNIVCGIATLKTYFK
jgi:hypothetical protein